MANAAITLQMQPSGTACVKSMQGSSWPQSIIVIFQDADGKPVNLTGCVPRIFAGPNGAFNDGNVLDAFSGTAQFGVTPDMTAIPGQYACSFSLPNTSCPDFKVDRLTLRVVIQQDGIYYAFLNQMPGADEDIQTQINNIKTGLSSKVTEQDIQTAVSGITIGAVQLLPNSATLPTLHGWSQNSNTDPTDEGGGFYRLPLNSSVAEILQDTSVATIHGAIYTESFYFKTDSTTLGFSFDFYEQNNKKENIIQAAIQNLGSGLYRACATATVGDTAIRAIDIKDLIYTDGTYIEIGKPKFEYGNKATDYSEADVDFNSQIGTINQTLLTHSSEISQNTSDISLRVLTSTYNSYTAANDSAVSNLQSRMSSAELKITPQVITSTVASNITGNQIASIINQSATTVSIDASKINMNGFVTLTQLSTPGATTISGSNIDTSTLKVQKIYNSGSNYYGQIGSFTYTNQTLGAMPYTGIEFYGDLGFTGGIYGMKDAGMGKTYNDIMLSAGQNQYSSVHSQVIHEQDPNPEGYYGTTSLYAGCTTSTSDWAEVVCSTEDGPKALMQVAYDTGSMTGRNYFKVSKTGVDISGAFPSAPLGSAAWHNENEGYWDTYVTRIGNLCFICGSITCSAVSAGTVVMTIPVGFRPSKRVSANTFQMGANGNIRLDITTAGELIMMAAIPYDGWIGLNLFYRI